ncbi:hypothetical protein A1342_06375 [Methylomonas methanica]|uniref:Beta-lactamase class A catalytic domain-containing protein n=1 Tax=Methylomonas denitrificans TaxID=1538553 RepID=A0A126T8T7_9GAMM|nr:hypothetical protein JT25_018450 [Methylomonas denitrificans]OAI04150.1 hypothetical protein A1342_06375 [Methylomonas methanica]
MEPDQLNPGYFFAKNHGLIRDKNLDKKLQELMAKLAANRPPFDSEPFKTFVANRGKVMVALVDLSTKNKLVFPELAEFNSTRITPGGSLAKIGLLYAAFQNRFDFNTLAGKDPRSLTADRIAKLKAIYDVTVSGSPAVAKFEFNDDFSKTFSGICHNCDASKISRSLGLAYVNSALWQSGLYDCRWGGIWIGAHYNEWINKNQKWECDTDPTFYKGNCTSEGCHVNPKGGSYIDLTALAVANFFTLLAQGRLIDDFSSQRLMDILLKQAEPDSGCNSRFKAGLTAAGRFDAGDRIYSKIGVTQSVSHEGGLIDRRSIGKKYVAVVLTVSNAGTAINGMVRQKLIVHLDDLIKANP